MKRAISLLCIFALLFAFAACRTVKETGGAEQTEAPESQGGQQLRLIDGAGTAQLVLAGETEGELYTVSTGEMTVFLDGEPAAASDLKNGMLLTLDPGSTLLETWPAQIVGGTFRAHGDVDKKADHGDLAGLYLQVLEDLWTEDSGLNGDITYISVDLENAPGGLTDGEKAAVAWIFAGRHNAQPLTLGFEALKENGYVKPNELYWENGLLFSIKASEKGGNSASKITFDAQKWRSGDGAIFFTACTAKRGDGIAWEPYQPGGFAIA